ncbi:MAG: UDP-N-acetylglucosamine 1-carboxyvinyltransferase [Chloroflexi bacterium]|nr:UDP-N-acetylglucosamine 1-carboxyvinyltransferase [Chloroflexota bacterium]
MRIAVQGRVSLRGDYHPSGNSNAAIGAIAAAMLTEAPTSLKRFPRTRSTEAMLNVAQQLGTTIVEDKANTIQLLTPHIQTRILDPTMTRDIAASILFLAPMIIRRQHARIDWLRPINRLHTHLTALHELGQTVDVEGHHITVTAERWDTAELVLTWPSVTATALVCMLAAGLGRKTTIYNAASEPHLRLLQHQLVQLGAQVEGIGSNLVTIFGWGDKPGPADVELPTDHIEIASIAAISAMNEGQVDIHDVYLPDMRMILKVYERLGMDYYLENTPENGDHQILHIPEQRHLKISRASGDTPTIDTAPWPGFPSDLMAITTVLATQARGTTLIHEKLFDNRLLFTDKIKAMGGNILLCDPHRAVVFGHSPLRGEYIDSPDVRVGLALLAAALCAEGETIIDNAQLIDWAFHDITTKLSTLGAKIEGVSL